LPQILKKAGVRYLSTIKLAIWNDTNIFPHTTFNWEGIDGSRVLVHFPPTHIVTPIDPGNMTINWKDNFQKKEAGISMYQFGWADGGGGPNREMWQLARRYKDCPGVPRSKISTIRDFFQRLDENSHRYPVWADELYLETHRGSYTTQAKIKAGNRKSELTLRDTEILSTFAEDIKSLKKITLLWKRVLVTQFHDTLAGSHIRETAESTEREYEEILGECARLKEQLLSKIAAKVDISLLELNNKTEITPLMVFNTLPWERGVTQIIKLPQGYSAHLVLKDEEGNVCPLQCVGIRDMAAVSIPAIPAMGYKIFYFSEAKKVENPLMANNLTISNSFFEREFNESGDICRITDKKAKRQVLPQGALANTFHIYEDRPGRYSAWDIVKSYREREFFLEPADSVKIVERGPVRAVVEVKRKVLQSQLTQRIILWKDSPRIDFRTEIDWREDSKLLKVAFPVEVFSRNATYDIPFGAIERPTHATTSWDEAKFEVCGHKWADLSEGNYGVSLLTDSKYGYEVVGNTMRLTLLRAPTFPDPKADRGFHTFTYSLFPHVGNWREGGTVKEAFALNVPALIHVADVHGGDYKSSYAFLNLDTGSFVVETIKRNEEGVILLRGYESEQKRGEASIKFNFNIDSVYACNLLEEVEKKLTVTNNSFVFSYRPYEIRSFLIKLR
jgi:alpha-mannosidase